MRVLFLLPDIQDVPTGGNIFNKGIVEALGVFVEVDTRVFCQGDVLEKGFLNAYDYVVVDSLLVNVIAPAVLSGTRASPKWVFLAHYLAPCDPAMEDVGYDDLLVSLQAYDGFITTSTFSKACLVRLGVAAHMVEVVYPGLDDGYYCEPQDIKRRRGGCRMLTVSSLLPGKGLVEFVDVLEELPAGDWQWDIVGDDALDETYAAAFKQKIKDARVSSRLRWLGAVPSAQMPALYHSYDLFVLPSRFETLGMALREAMASGLPVVAYDVGGISESLGQGGGDLIAPFGQVQMRDSIWRFIDNPDLRRRMGLHAREKSEAFPSWEISAIKMVTFIEKA